MAFLTPIEFPVSVLPPTILCYSDEQNFAWDYYLGTPGINSTCRYLCASCCKPLSPPQSDSQQLGPTDSPLICQVTRVGALTKQLLVLEGLIVPFPGFAFQLEELKMSLHGDALIWGGGARWSIYSCYFYLSNTVCLGLCGTGEFFSFTPVLGNSLSCVWFMDSCCSCEGKQSQEQLTSPSW